MQKLQNDELIALAYCKKIPWFFFLNFLFTLERQKGKTPFPDYEYLKKLVRILNRRLVLVFKSRQMLISWAVTAYIVWDMIFNGNSDNLFISKRKEDAMELLHRAKFIYDNLPVWMKIDPDVNTKSVIELRVRNSRIISMPATPDIGRTYSPSRIFADEMAFMPYDREIFSSLQPALDGGGAFIGVSTSNGPFTKHAELLLGAPGNGFERVDIHYSLHPEKGERWIAEAKKGMSPEDWKREQEMDLYSSGNLVYDSFNESNHVKNIKYRQGLRTFRGIDFGYHTPVVLWGQLTAEDRLIIFDEWIGENNTTEEMIEAVKLVDSRNGINEENIEMTFCDPAGAAKNDEGISPVEKLKSAGIKVDYRSSGVAAGVNLMREKLKSADGRVSLLVSGSCKRLISDFRGYRKKEHSDEPKKDGTTDHTMDTLRYMVVNIFQKKRIDPVSLLKPKIFGIER
ncbi:hypothetical protein ACFL4T_03505 [candidate division KSB1 bacterium]